MNYIASNVCLKSSNTHPSISYGNFYYSILLIKQPYVPYRTVCIEKKIPTVLESSIRNEGVGVISYVDIHKTIRMNTYKRGVVIG